MTCRGCESRTAVGCLCDIAASDSFTVAGDGSEATPFTISPDLDADLDNLFSCSVDGLLAALPAYLADPPSASVFRTSNQTITTATDTAISFNAENYDTDTMHITAARERITFTTAGVYLVTLNVVWDKVEQVRFHLARIRKNGTDVLAFDTRRVDATSSDLYVAHSLSCLEQFSAADYVEAIVYQNTGANLDVIADDTSPVFAAKRMAT